MSPSPEDPLNAEVPDVSTCGDPQAHGDGWENEPAVLSRQPTPLSRPPSPLTPLSSDVSWPESRNADLPAPANILPAHKCCQSAGKGSRRARHCVAKAQGSVFGPLPQPHHSQHHDCRRLPPHVVRTRAASIPSSAGGSWIGSAAEDKKSEQPLLSLEKLLADGNELLTWDGRRTKLLLEAEGRTVGVLLGQPEVDDWAEAIDKLARVLEGSSLRSTSTSSVTSAGCFDYKRGGHIYIKPLKTVCEFPSGSTILLLSGTCAHGNTPIQTGETRYLMTQYATSALFRWAAYGHQSVKSLLAQPEGATQKLDGKEGACMAWALGLLSKPEELDADRQAVFGDMSESSRR
ncbi:hypothetical protein C8R45DRAFT_1185853 [Mycena sanguinolenta]|nr:hypothetical protein C8R45DRAFT_1185853 [Mycena sanguinolenta]